MAYYRDVFIWLPDVMWPGLLNIKNPMMPCCPNCKTNARVGPHCFRENSAGRLIIGLEENYYCISRRYICSECEDKAKIQPQQVRDLATSLGVIAEVGEVDDEAYTFMAWNMNVLPLYPYDRGSKFPAWLSWRAGVDKVLLRQMRPLFDGGFRPGAYSRLLLELHSLRYLDYCLEHENEIKAKLESPMSDAMTVDAPLGDFGDKMKYNDHVPTGRYLSRIYCEFHRTIRPHLSAEVKKRDADRLDWDVSYKESKHLCKYKGRSVFKGYVTALNSIGEVRIQFHVFSDSHEQMVSALEAFKLTQANFGMPGIRLFTTDNPTADKDFFLSELPSLQAQQDKFDAIVQKTDTTSVMEVDGPIAYDFRKLTIQVVSQSNEMVQKMNAIIDDIMRTGVIGLDAKWDVNKNAMGLKRKRSKT